MKCVVLCISVSLFKTPGLWHGVLFLGKVFQSSESLQGYIVPCHKHHTQDSFIKNIILGA